MIAHLPFIVAVLIGSAGSASCSKMIVHNRSRVGCNGGQKRASRTAARQLVAGTRGYKAHDKRNTSGAGSFGFGGLAWFMQRGSLCCQEVHGVSGTEISSP